MKLQIVIPLWNEEKNICQLVTMIEASPLVRDGTLGLILVDNGSQDRTGVILKELSQNRKWISVVHLERNQNYGGGIFAGLVQTVTPYVGFIPGDLQVHMSDLEKIWNEYLKIGSMTKTLVKGNRTTRLDGFSTRLVSWVYTFLANRLLGISVRDINGLPKVFDRRLLELLSSEVMKSFVWDAQLLATAHHHRWKIIEVPVTFHARREGISSWSGKRFKVYIESIRLLLRIRRKGLAVPTREI